MSWLDESFAVADEHGDESTLGETIDGGMSGEMTTGLKATYHHMGHTLGVPWAVSSSLGIDHTGVDDAIDGNEAGIDRFRGQIGAGFWVTGPGVWIGTLFYAHESREWDSDDLDALDGEEITQGYPGAELMWSARDGDSLQAGLGVRTSLDFDTVEAVLNIGGGSITEGYQESSTVSAQEGEHYDIGAP